MSEKHVDFPMFEIVGYTPVFNLKTGVWKKVKENENGYHCLDGPAVIRGDGVEEYWIDGKQYPKEEWERVISMKAFW
jgi:hypothetical protein